MKLFLNKKGFTLVELLGTIVILGILMVVAIVSVTKLIDRSKKEQRTHQEDTLVMAAKSYLQDNRSQLPKAIGETTTITAETLKTNKYLTQNIKDANKKSCMTNSYVTAYKESKTKYVYKAYLYCGNETPPAEVAKPIPTIKIEFFDGSGNSLDTNKVSEAKYRITITGGKKADNTPVAIDGYSYTILANSKEVYTSGTLSANRKSEIIIDKDNNLKDYVDITTATTIKIKVVVRNVEGGLKDETVTAGGDSSKETTFNDKQAPSCGTQKNVPTTWINKYSATKTRKITISCTDKGESGCIRDSFTKTWPNKDQTSVENGIIQIKDNAGNIKNCPVVVKIDLDGPVVNIDAFKRNSSGNKEGSSVFDGAIKTSAGAANDAVTVDATKYKNLNGNYMNKAQYPNGIVYEVKLTDNIGLGKWTWNTNKAGLISTDAEYKSVSASGADHASGDCSKNSDSTKCNFTIAFTQEGQRKGVLTVLDKAGNKVTYTINANLDITAPKKPTVIYTKNNGDRYTSGWVNATVKSQVNGGNKDVSNGQENNKISGWSKYEYSYKKPNGTTVTGSTTNGNLIETEGINEIKYRSCDKANNCSAWTDPSTIYIDKTPPTCKVTQESINGSPSSTGWYNASSGQRAGVRVSRKCEDSGGSGCNTSTNGYYDYTGDINTTSAGSLGDGRGGQVKDNAGNVANCAANQTVKIDKTRPTCGTIVGASTKWRNRTTMPGTGIDVKLICNDDGSRCENNMYTYNIRNDGTRRFEEIKDNAGNVTTCEFDLYIDTQPPRCGRVIQKEQTGEDTKKGVSAIVECKEDQDYPNGASGCNSREYSTDRHKGYFTKKIKDNAGNIEECPVNVRVNPECGISKVNCIKKTRQVDCTKYKKCGEETVVSYHTSQGCVMCKHMEMTHRECSTRNNHYDLNYILDANGVWRVSGNPEWGTCYYNCTGSPCTMVKKTTKKDKYCPYQTTCPEIYYDPCYYSCYYIQ